MFINNLKIKLIAGSGGKGGIFFRREAHSKYGGPYGGNGGNGGNIIVESDSNLFSLYNLNLKKKNFAENGENGKNKKMNGKKGKDLIIKLPIGSTIYNLKNDKLLIDLNKNIKNYIIAKGGKGGKGNKNIANSLNFTPFFSEDGKKGEEIDIKIVMRFLVDVVLLGFPSSGKSTLFSYLTGKKVKISNYPFTTLYPNYGFFNRIKKYKKKKLFSLIDSPALIKNSYLGKGLGNSFLKCFERSKIICLVIDISIDKKKILKNINILKNELKKSYFKFFKKKILIVANKMDLKNSKKNFFYLKKKIDFKIFPIISKNGKGVLDLIFEIYKILKINSFIV